MAFESNTKNTWKQYMHYYYGILKAILCALTQSLGMCIIMVDYVETGMDCREADSYQDWEAICPGGLTELFTTGENPWVIFGSLQYKILAFLFSAFLGMCSVKIQVVLCSMMLSVSFSLWQCTKYSLLLF